jgi:large subunit ribosomal protein L24
MHTSEKCSVKCRIKKGDEVRVVSGEERGKSGKVLRVIRKADRVIVDGLNIKKRHTKPSMANQDGGIVDKPMSMHISNVMLIDPKSKKPTRVGFKMEGGKKVRFAKDSGAILV